MNITSDTEIIGAIRVVSRLQGWFLLCPKGWVNSTAFVLGGQEAEDVSDAHQLCPAVFAKDRDSPLGLRTTGSVLGLAPQRIFSEGYWTEVRWAGLCKGGPVTLMPHCHHLTTQENRQTNNLLGLFHVPMNYTKRPWIFGLTKQPPRFNGFSYNCVGYCIRFLRMDLCCCSFSLRLSQGAVNSQMAGKVSCTMCMVNW